MSVGPVDRDEATAEFFDAAAAGVFLLRRCPAGHWSEPPAAQCTTCGSTALRWEAAAGGATLVSWAVTWAVREPGPASPDRAGAAQAGAAQAEAGQTGPGPELAATVLVIAELDEGPWWWSQLTAADPAALAVGDRLVISFAAEAGHEPVPVFHLAGRPPAVLTFPTP
jgi:uncharacterized OB-fold protein